MVKEEKLLVVVGIAEELPMKTYSEFIQESSLNRIASKSDKGGVGYISAERADKSKKRK